MLDSRPGQGTTFRIIIPRFARTVVPGGAAASPAGNEQWPIRTMSSN
jgi:hypothetical protein